MGAYLNENMEFAATALAALVIALVIGIVLGRASKRRVTFEPAPAGTPLLESRTLDEAAAGGAFGTYQQFLAERGVPRAEIDQRMREFLDQFTALRQALREAAPADGKGESQTVFDEARDVIEAGAFDRAVEILGAVGAEQAASARDFKQTAERRLTAAAAVEALIGDLLFAQTAYANAARHYQEAIALVPDSEAAVRTDYLNKHGTASYSAANFLAAADSFEKALAIRERTLDAHDPEIATALNNLAMVRYAQGNYEAAEPLYKRALLVDERNHGADHPTIATDLNNLALLYKKQGNLLAAEPLLRRALVIKERVLPTGDPSLVRGLRNYASVLRALKRHEEADRLEARAAALLEPAPIASAAETDRPDSAARTAS